MPDPNSLSRLAEDFRRANEQHQEHAAASTSGNFSTESVLGFSLEIGDRVLDTVSGKEGTIVDRRQRHVLAAPAPTNNG